MPFRVGKGRSNFRFIVRGKTGERDVILRSAAARRLDKLLAKSIGGDSNNFLFVMPDGSKVISLIDQFNTAPRDAGIERNGFGEKYSLYSLRHFYAALRNGVGVFEIARNMGTSVQISRIMGNRRPQPSLLLDRGTKGLAPKMTSTSLPTDQLSRDPDGL